MSSGLRNRVTAAAAAVPILVLYLIYLTSISGRVSPLVANSVEGTIIASQLLRLLIVASYPRLRFAQASLLFIIFSVEVVLMVPLAVASFLLGSTELGRVVATLFLSWPAAASMVVIPFAIYRLFHDMSARARLSSVLPSAAMQFGFLSLLISAVAGASESVFGLTGLTRQIVLALIGSTTAVQLATGDALYLVVSASLYVALVAYVLSGVSGPRIDRLVRPLMLFCSGSALLAAWVLVGGSLTASSLYLLFVPCALLTFGLWWSTRG
jgi:hypothetical protein